MKLIIKELLFLVLFVLMGIGTVRADRWRNYDFSSTTSSGQTLYYRIDASNRSNVWVVRPDYEGFIDFHNMYDATGWPSGALTIPAVVSDGTTTYSVTTIGDGFVGCSGLTSVTIPSSITSIPNGAFRGCVSLTSLVVVTGNTIYDSRNNCNAIIETATNTLIVGTMNTIIPNSITSIGDNAFEYCSGLTSVTVPNSVTSIGDYAFSSCSSLASVTIPNSVTSIGDGVFVNCSGLTSVTIPNSITSIGDGVFVNCSGLTSVTIPNSITSIGYSAFAGCSGLTSATIPNSVTYIGEYAFQNCTSLSHVTFNARNCSDPSTSSYRPFGGCTNISSVIIGDSVQRIPAYLFYSCSGLTSVTIPNSVTEIGSAAFRNCSSLSHVTFNARNSSDYTSSPFSGCTNISSAIIGDSVQRIPTYLFSGCSGLTSITIPNSVSSIGNGAFSDCTGLTSVTIPNSVTSIGDYAFSSCSSLASVTIPNSVTSIGDHAFYRCSGLTSATIGNSVTSIGNYAFSGCYGLTSVTIPNSVTSIGNEAFHNCSGLTSAVIGNSVTSIGTGAFRGCRSLSHVTFNARNCSAPPSSPFSECTNISSAIIGDSVQRIPAYLFSSCSGLTSVTIPNSVTSIGDYAFRGCSSLTDIFMLGTIPPVRSYYTFLGCPTTMLIHIPCGSFSAYCSYYYDSDMLVEEYEAPSYDVFSSDTTKGQVRILRVPEDCYNNTLRVSAIPYDGYIFTHWQDGDTSNPRNVEVFRDIVLTAYFASYDVYSSDTTKGQVRILRGSEDWYSNILRVSAIPYDGYVFTHWQDGDTNNPRNVEVLRDTVLTAYFAIPIYDTVYIYVPTHKYNLSVISRVPEKGLAAGNGSFPDGTEVEIAAIPNEGYSFNRWADDNRENPRRVLVNGDATYYAIFAANNKGERDGKRSGGTVQEVAIAETDMGSDDVFSTMTDTHSDTIAIIDTIYYTNSTYYNLTVTSENTEQGLASGNGRFLDSCAVEIAAIPIEGNRFVQWHDGNTENPRTVIVSDDMTFVATFEARSTEGISDVEGYGYTVSSERDVVTVSGAAGQRVRIFDSMGRLLKTETEVQEVHNFQMPASGAYLIQVGDAPAQKVVVVR